MEDREHFNLTAPPSNTILFTEASQQRAVFYLQGCVSVCSSVHACTVMALFNWYANVTLQDSFYNQITGYLFEF